MRIETIEQARGLRLEDAAVTGILWGDTGRDLIIRMRLSDDSSADLACSWFVNLRIDLNFKNLTKSLTWNVVFSKNDKGIWHIAFDFGGKPDGIFEFDCTDIDFTRI